MHESSLEAAVGSESLQAAWLLMLLVWPEASSALVPTDFWVGTGLGANYELDGGSHSTSSSVCKVEHSQTWLPPESKSPGRATAGPPPRLSHDQQVGSGPGSYQNPAFALGSSACEILCAPFKSEVYFFQSYETFSRKPCVLQSHVFWGHIFPVQDSWAEKLNLGLSTLAFMG